MTDRSNHSSKRDKLAFEDLLAQSSVGGTTDPDLDHACTDEEAAAFAAKYRHSLNFLEHFSRTHDTSPYETMSEENKSEIRRVEILRTVWTELTAYVRWHVCEDRTLMAEIMHEAAATFTYYWREKGELSREHALAVLQRAAKLHGRQGRYKLDLSREIDAVLADFD